MMRSTTSRIGAITPIWAKEGRQPIRKVARPIINSVMKRIDLRPSLSP